MSAIETVCCLIELGQGTTDLGWLKSVRLGYFLNHCIRLNVHSPQMVFGTQLSVSIDLF